jgi:YgiT-type zinc finger domain-containing protein
MQAVKRDTMSQVTYPDSYTCVCGREAPLKYKNIKTLYKGKYITVENVPVYECEVDHLKMARVTRVKMKQLLKHSYEDFKDRVEYK